MAKLSSVELKKLEAEIDTKSKMFLKILEELVQEDKSINSYEVILEDYLKALQTDDK